MDYWVNYPPTHILLRAYMGLGKDDEKPKNLDTATDEEMEEFMSACGGGFGGMTRTAGHSL